MRRRSWYPALLLLVGALPAGQDMGHTGAFVIRLGADTVGLERFGRHPEGWEGVYVTRTPRTTLYRYRASVDAQGVVRRFEVRAHRPGSDSAFQVLTLALAGDSGVMAVTRDGETRTQQFLIRTRTTPIIVGAIGPVETLTRRARAQGTPLSVPIVFVGSSNLQTARVEAVDGDSLAVQLGAIGPLRYHVDTAGGILGGHGRGSTMQVTVERVPSLDVEALAQSFATRGLGPLSPRDTARATFDSATLWVDYGRPGKRGREIFGAVVPWDQVWRTGANAASQFSTSVDLEMDGVTIPAGSYTLWTIPRPTGWTLIVNQQTGQWGTAYDESQDLVRLPMRVETLTTPVDRFTIDLEPTAGGGVLSLAWDRTRASVAFRVK